MGFLGTMGYYVCIPFAALLRLFYNMTGSYGLSLIFFTLVIKLVLLPFQMKSKKSMVRMNRMSGKMKEIQKKYANNPAKQQEETQKLYAEQGVSPMSGCLWSMLPMFFLIALYAIIRQPITHFMMLDASVVDSALSALQSAGVNIADIATTAKDGALQVTAFGQIMMVNAINTQLPEFAASIPGWISVNYSFLGMDLSVLPSNVLQAFTFTWANIGVILMPVISAGLSFLMSMASMAGQDKSSPAARQMKTMLWMMPLMSLWIGFTLPAALCVYWIAQSAFSAVQEWFMGKFYNKKIEEEENQRQEAIEADRRRRQEEAKGKQEELRQQQALKPSLKEKRKAAQEAKSNKPKKASTNENGRLGDRPYARGRAYQESRYGDSNEK
ncbi:membrane protein insertase YidC [Oscillibacter sp. GMB15532]|uniref:membrane protein insertase YidC n=1 Tax=Oscillibacter sp. GMB15532 TaxID=3230022 RepID=UPI0034E04FF1